MNKNEVDQLFNRVFGTHTFSDMNTTLNFAWNVNKVLVYL